MRDYHDALHRYELSSGSIFATLPYDAPVQTYRQSLVRRVASNAIWRCSPMLSRKPVRGLAHGQAALALLQALMRRCRLGKLLCGVRPMARCRCS